MLVRIDRADIRGGLSYRIIKKDDPPVLFLCSALRLIATSGIAYLLMAVNHYLSWNAGYPLGAL